MDRLARMDELTVRDTDLATWLASPSATWPLSEAVAVREGDRVTVRPKIADEPVSGGCKRMFRTLTMVYNPV